MMDRAKIRDLSDKAARNAARTKKEPYVVFDAAEVERKSFKIPFLGDYVPPGWEKVNELFCDSSGFGSPGEPALTQSQLQREMVRLLGEKDTFGYGITEAGQFQVYVGVYRRTGKVAGKVKVDTTDVWPGDRA